MQAQSNDSCYSKSGTVSANIQTSYVDKIDEPVVFDANNSTGVGDFFKEPIEWNFGDGFKAKMCRATHFYRNPGNYIVTLKVRDNQGNLSTATTSITIGAISPAVGNNILTVVTNNSGNGVTTFNTVQEAVDKAATLNGAGTVEIILPAGAIFSENVELKVPQGNNYITLKSSFLGNLPRGIRVNRSDLSNVATIKSPLNNLNLSVLRTELKSPTSGQCNTSQTCLPAHHYRLQGIQFMVDVGTLPNGYYENIVALGTDDDIQNEESEQAHHLIMDRCLLYVEDYSSTNPNPQPVKNGIESNAKNMSILDSHFSGINIPGAESHALNAYNSTGVWTISNNYFEAGSINLLIGGANPKIPNAVVQDVEVRRNRFHKPLEKRFLPYDHRWSAKNNFEIKSGKHWLIEENLFDGNWIGADQRYLVNFNALADDTGPQTTVQDIQFSGNIIKQGPAGILIARVPGSYNNVPLTTRFLISNNLLTELGGTEYGLPGCQAFDCEAAGQGFVVSHIPSNLIVRHNTMIVRQSIMVLSGTNFQPMVFKDNITNHGTVYQDGWGYGIKGDGVNSGCPSIDFNLPGCSQVQSGGIAYLPNSEFSKNVITNILFDSRYPGNAPYPYHSLNYYYATQNPNNPIGFENIDNHFVNRANGNYHIASGSPGKTGASDGTDVGANIDVIDIVSVKAVTGNWETTSNQTPYPGPNAPNIPITLEVENFDNGGQSIAYNENYGNTGSGVYRSTPVEAVDIQARSTASNGYVVFEASAGEWLEYTINVPVARKYDIGVRYASEFNNGKFHIEIDGVDVTGQMTVVSTGNWGTFKNLTKRGVMISAGTHVVRLALDTNSPDGCNCIVGNFDAIRFTSTLFDFDDDGRADISLFRPSDSNWYLDRSSAGFTAVSLGASTDIIAPGDFDGDGKTDVSVFRPSNGTWYRYNSSNSGFVAIQFGANGDIPVQADYDGDGKSDIAVWRPSNGTWYYLKSSDGSFVGTAFGQNNDKPAVGDFDGDGKSDLAVFRPSNGYWYILNSFNASVTSVVFGAGSDNITPADYDGDGKTDVAVFRPSNGTWYLQRSSLGFTGVAFGQSGDIPVPADYDGDGKADVGIFRPSTGGWSLLRSTEGTTTQVFGQSSDVPIPSTYVR